MAVFGSTLSADSPTFKHQSTMTHSTFCIALLVLFTAAATAQQPEWIRMYGGIEGEQGTSIAAAHGGGFLTAGFSTSEPLGKNTIYLVRTDNNGMLGWEKRIAIDNYAEAVALLANDTTYTLIAHLKRFDNTSSTLIATIDTAGQIIDSHQVGGSGRWPRSAARTADGGVIISGHNGNAAMIMRVDASGALMWERTIQLGSITFPNSITATGDGGFVLTGYVEGGAARGRDFFLLKLNADGDSLWSRAVGTAGTEAGNAVIETASGELLAAGLTGVSQGAQLFLVVRTDRDGVVQELDTLGSPELNRVLRLKLASNGDALLLGQSGSFTLARAVVIRLSAQGDLIARQAFGPEKGLAWVTDAIEIAGGAFILTGGYVDTSGRPDTEVSNYDFIIAKYGGITTSVDIMRILLPRWLDLR